jgi:hypothetical protein
MYEKLKQVKREAVIEASREFKTMMESARRKAQGARPARKAQGAKNTGARI